MPGPPKHHWSKAHRYLKRCSQTKNSSAQEKIKFWAEYQMPFSPLSVTLGSAQCKVLLMAGPTEGGSQGPCPLLGGSFPFMHRGVEALPNVLCPRPPPLFLRLSPSVLDLPGPHVQGCSYTFGVGENAQKGVTIQTLCKLHLFGWGEGGGVNTHTHTQNF